MKQIRLVIEESLNQLPFTKCTVTTPTNELYQGLKYQRGNCGVSIIRSGEAMEQASVLKISESLTLYYFTNCILIQIYSNL